MEEPHVGGLGGTYGGNPIGCRAALAVLDFLDQTDLAAKASRIGEIARKRFVEMQQRFPLIGDVRGLGAMIGLELVRDRKTKEPAPDESKKLVKFCHEHGLILLTCGRYGNVIRTLMPLVITDDQLDEGLTIIERAFASIHHG
jgi:4-aminobutyrate aminotransferase/(S)-3-amino-2-methylpropionate transaminase